MSCMRMIAPGRAPATARLQTMVLLRSAQSRVSTDHKIEAIPRWRSCSRTTLFTAPYGGRMIVGAVPVAWAIALLVRSISLPIASALYCGRTGWLHEWLPSW